MQQREMKWDFLSDSYTWSSASVKEDNLWHEMADCLFCCHTILPLCLPSHSLLQTLQEEHHAPLTNKMLTRNIINTEKGPMYCTIINSFSVSIFHRCFTSTLNYRLLCYCIVVWVQQEEKVIRIIIEDFLRKCSYSEAQCRQNDFDSHCQWQNRQCNFGRSEPIIFQLTTRACSGISCFGCLPNSPNIFRHLVTILIIGALVVPLGGISSRNCFLEPLHCGQQAKYAQPY